jgi:hypothetical protein
LRCHLIDVVAAVAIVQAASASDRDRSKGASRTDHPVDRHGAHCEKYWLSKLAAHEQTVVCSLGPSRTRHANLHLMSTPTGPVLLSGVDLREAAP